MDQKTFRIKLSIFADMTVQDSGKVKCINYDYDNMY